MKYHSELFIIERGVEMRGDRKKDYKADSTKGKSMINPLNYKGEC